MYSFCLRQGRFEQFSRNKFLFVFSTADFHSLQGAKPGLLRIQADNLLNCDCNKFFGRFITDLVIFG